MQGLDTYFITPQASILEQSPLLMLRRSLRKHYLNIPAATIQGPLLLDTMSTEAVLLIRGFQNEQFQRKQAYLLGEAQQALERELAIHERCAYFVAKRNDVIVGVLRLCPAPFEFERLLAHTGKTWPDFSLHVEVSRFVVANCECQTSTSMLLIVEACAWAMSHGYEGIVALCRPATRMIFERYGLSTVWPDYFCIPTRNNQRYALLSSRWQALILGATRASEAALARTRQTATRHDPIPS